MKRIIPIIVIMLTALAAGAQVKSYQLTVGDFNEIKLNGPVNVDYSVCPDSAGMVCFEAPDAKASYMEFGVKKGRLNVSVTFPEGCTDRTLPTVRVYSNNLQRVENVSDSTLRVLNEVRVPFFTIKLMGNGCISVRDVVATEVSCTLLTGRGRIAVGGRCNSAKFSLTGAGTIQADALQADKASCMNTGTGTIGVNAANQLTVKGSGGHVYYFGMPEIDSRFALGVHIDPM